jgi:hypothetical protein
MATRLGDWFCPTCQFIIYASKDKCRKCEYRRGDWFCQKCKIGNDPTAIQCVTCKQSKDTAASEAVVVTKVVAAAAAATSATPAVATVTPFSLEARVDALEQRLRKLEAESNRRKEKRKARDSYLENAYDWHH